jgi:lipoprotein-anchoring transpeptidase ErfK/SrfK
MQPIADAFRPSGVVTERRYRLGKPSAAMLATAIAVTAFAGFHAEPRSAASTTATTPATVRARSGTGVGKPVTPPSTRPTARHHALKSPCVHNSQAQLIVVSIEHQHEWACAHQRTVLSTPVTTGATSRTGDATPRGTFAVQGLNRDTVLTTNATGRYHVRYWIPFRLGVWGFHDASWQTMPFGSNQYVTRGSHGCVHMPLPAIRWLFHWVHYGAQVRII